MPRWTKEQEEAINKEGMNIIVSAGAGSGKTAVLTERVITKIKKGIPVDHLLILTFTKAAASEMKERIRASIKKMNNEEELNKLDSAYITTFDSFSLSIVKKYHYLLNVSKNINIGNDNVFKLKKEQILDEIFEELYQERNPEFLKLIGDFCVKDDLEIRDYILSIREKLDMKVDSKEFLDNYLNNYYNESFMDKIISSYTHLLINKIEELKLSLEELSYYVDGTYYTKVLETLNPLLKSTDYLGIKENLNIKFPSLPRGSEDVTKEKKENVVSIIKVLKDLVTYEDEEDIKNKLKSTYEYANIIVFILQKLDQKIKKFKFENDITFNQSAFRYGFAIYDENKNVYEVFSRMYFNSKEKMDYRTLYTYKDLGIKNYKNKVYELMLSDGCQSGSVLVGDKEITINVDITAKDSFPESKKLYINVFDLGYIEAKFDENNKPQVTDFNLSNTEWQFEVDC